MKARPILFSGPMVRALLDGSKTQTRRAVKPQPLMVAAKTIEPWEGNAVDLQKLLEQSGKRCHYGQPGDWLWVREAYRFPASYDQLPPRSVSDSEGRRFVADEVAGADAGYGKQRPGMFMPRWASRITLEIVSVRIERLQDISEVDAKAEGIKPDEVRQIALFGASADERADMYRRAAVRPYRHTWESINGAGSWDANPWLWVIKFKKVTS